MHHTIKQNKIITNYIKKLSKTKLHHFTQTFTKSATRLIFSLARDPRLLHETLGWTADQAPDIYTVQLWNYNKLICPEAALLSQDKTQTDHEVRKDQLLCWIAKRFAFHFWNKEVGISDPQGVVAVSIYLHLYKETKGANKPFTCIFMIDETMVTLTKMLNYSYQTTVAKV